MLADGCLHDLSVRPGHAVAVGLDYLQHVGIAWSPHPQEEVVRHEYERIGSLAWEPDNRDLIDLPPMEDPASLATVEVLSKLDHPAYFADANLAALAMCKAASLSLEHGIAMLPVSAMSSSRGSPDRVLATVRPGFDSATSATNSSSDAG